MLFEEVEGVCSASSSAFFVLFQHVFSTYPSLAFLCTSHYHLNSSLIDNAICEGRDFSSNLFVLISVFLTSLSVWYRCHFLLFCRQESLKNQQISGRIALPCHLYTSKDFIFFLDRCSSAFSLMNTKIRKCVGRTKIMYLKEKKLVNFWQFQITEVKKNSLGDKCQCV